MNTIFMNSKNSKTSDPHRQLLNLIDKTDLRRKDKYTALSNLNILYTSKNMKKGQIFAILANFCQIRKIKFSQKIHRQPIREIKSTREKKIIFFRFSELVKLTFLH